MSRLALPDSTIKYAPYTQASMHAHLEVMPLINLHCYFGIEAFDPYITTQVNGIHTIARHMDDENENSQVST